MFTLFCHQCGEDGIRTFGGRTLFSPILTPLPAYHLYNRLGKRKVPFVWNEATSLGLDCVGMRIHPNSISCVCILMMSMEH